MWGWNSTKALQRPADLFHPRDWHWPCEDGEGQEERSLDALAVHTKLEVYSPARNVVFTQLGRYGIFAAGNNSQDEWLSSWWLLSEPSITLFPQQAALLRQAQSIGYPQNLINWFRRAGVPDCQQTSVSRAALIHIRIFRLHNPSRLSTAVVVEAVQLSYSSVRRKYTNGHTKANETWERCQLASFAFELLEFRLMYIYLCENHTHYLAFSNANLRTFSWS